MCMKQESVFHTEGTASYIEIDENCNPFSKRSKVCETPIQAYIMLFSITSHSVTLTL